MMILNIMVCIVVILIGFNLKNAFKGFDERDKRILNRLFFFHMAIAVVFHLYIAAFGGDAQHYWGQPKVMPFSEILEMALGGSPSGTMFLLNYFPSKVLDLSFFTGNMIYAQLGFLGFLLLYRISKSYLQNFESLADIKIFGIAVFPWIWFLPNMHFWSGGIGKDTILFFCIAGFVYALQNLKVRILWMVVALIIATAVRPHITLFLIASFGLGYVFDGSLKGYQKVFIIVVFVVGLASIFNYVLDFIQLDSLETDVIEEYATTKSSSLNAERSGSGVDTSNYPLPLKIFTFLYRPLFFDINNAFSILASFENLILLIFTVKVFRSRPLRALRRSDFLLKGSLVFFLLGSIAFSLILGNLGIMLRQKNMFVPWFIVFGLWVFHYSYNQLKENES